MIIETLLSLLVILPGIITLLRHSRIEYNLTTMQRPAYSMFYHDIWGKNNILLGALLIGGGIIALTIGIAYNIEFEASFIAAYVIYTIIAISEYSYRLYLKKLLTDPPVEEEDLEIIKYPSRTQALIVLSFSVTAIVTGFASMILAYNWRLYSVILIQIAFITLVIYATLNYLKRPPYTAYPWLPRKWTTRLAYTIPISLSLILLLSSLVLLI
jgi:hypothetical protein